MEVVVRNRDSERAPTDKPNAGKFPALGFKITQHPSAAGLERSASVPSCPEGVAPTGQRQLSRGDYSIANWNMLSQRSRLSQVWLVLDSVPVGSTIMKLIQ